MRTQLRKNMKSPLVIEATRITTLQNKSKDEACKLSRKQIHNPFAFVGRIILGNYLNSHLRTSEIFLVMQSGPMDTRINYWIKHSTPSSNTTLKCITSLNTHPKVSETHLPQTLVITMILNMAVHVIPLPSTGCRTTLRTTNSIEAISNIRVLRY